MKPVILRLDALARILWAMALLFLPITSFRWFPFLGQGVLVRPLALYPLAILLPLLMIMAWQGRQKISIYWTGAFIALGVFVLFVIASASFGILIDPIPLRGQIYSGRTIRALVTLIIGIAFFVSAVWMNRNEEDLRFTVRWILAGLCLDILWSGLQAVTFYTTLLDREMVTNWQRSFSMRELVRTNRISGLAFEPAWLAGQLATIFLPWLFASVMTNYRISRLKWLEPVLLAFSLLVLLATYSRGGLFSTAVSAALTFLFFGRDLRANIWRWFRDGFRARMVDLLFRVGIILVTVGALAGSFIFLSQKEYFKNLWEINAESLSEYIVDINAGARGAYSFGAFQAFEEHPWAGVGLGASGFYIYNHLPDWSLTFVPEIAKQLSTGDNPETRLYPNPKNLYVRLLAETGLIGFFLFFAFQFYVLGDVLSLYLHKQPWTYFAVIAGVFAWLAILLNNFTQDSLTTPNLWLVPGILAGLSANLPPAQNKE